MPRIAFFSKHKRRTLYTVHIMQALRRIGCVVRHVNQGKVRRMLGRKLADKLVRRAVERFKPDAIVVFSGDIQDETLDHFLGKVPTGLLLDDYFPVDAPVTRFIKKVDVFFHTMTGQLQEYRDAGAKKAVYLHSGVSPDMHRPGKFDKRFKSDVAFMGGAHYPERNDFIRAVHENFDLKVYGSGWQGVGLTPARDSVAVRDFATICASARIVLGMDKTADRELYFSNRTWFVLGCGGFLLTRYVPGLERIFANHEHLAWFRDPEEAYEQIRFYLEHEDDRRRIARAGHAFAHEFYPFDRMARNMIQVLLHSGAPEPLTNPAATQ